MELVSGRGEVRRGRDGVRSGRAVVGVDVVSHTLPRSYRTPAPPPPCCPTTISRPHHDTNTDPGCVGCRVGQCSAADPPTSHFPALLSPYPAHHQYERCGWNGRTADCATCRALAQPVCACSDPCCLGDPVPSAPSTWGRTAPRQALGPVPRATLQAVRAASVCAIPKLDERFNPAFCRPLEHHHPHHHLHQQHLTPANTNTNSTPSSTTHVASYTSHTGSPHAYTLSKTQAHVHTINDSNTYLPQATHTSDSTSTRTNTTTNTSTANNKQQKQKGGGLSIIHAHHHHAHNHHHAHGHTLAPCEGGAGSRLSRSVEDLPTDIQDHILRCQCSCDHLGYGNYSTPSLQQSTGAANGCSSLSTKSNSKEEITQETKELNKKKQMRPGGLEVPAQVWGGVLCLVLVLAGVAGVGVSVPLALKVDPNAALHHRVASARTILRDTPLVDGHNDLPWNIRKFMHNKLHSFNFTAELKQLRPWSRSSWSHTDLPRLREGMVGAQFWVSYVPCGSQKLNAVQLTIEQIDLIKRLIDQYPDHLRLATSADEVEAAFKEGRIASLIGVEGGHAIQNSLGVLRALRDLGVRYLTLTHTCSTPWAECARAKETDAEDPNSPRGLTHFGKTVVREMNRLGLLVDLSHVSQATMRAALKVSRAPVIFSHSSVYDICKNPRNVPDDILKQVAVNGGVVMVSFYTHFLTCSQQASVKDVVDHINHVRKIAGVEHVGIGADFDGVNMLPEGLEDVSRYPHLFAELLSDPTWSEADLRLLAGQNLLRVMRDVEKVRANMLQQKVVPYEEEVPPDQLKGYTECSYKFNKDPDDS